MEKKTIRLLILEDNHNDAELAIRDLAETVRKVLDG